MGSCNWPLPMKTPTPSPPPSLGSSYIPSTYQSKDKIYQVKNEKRYQSCVCKRASDGFEQSQVFGPLPNAHENDLPPQVRQPKMRNLFKKTTDATITMLYYRRLSSRSSAAKRRFSCRFKNACPGSPLSRCAMKSYHLTSCISLCTRARASLPSSTSDKRLEEYDPVLELTKLEGSGRVYSLSS